MNIPYTYYRLEKSEYQSSVGFDIEIDWDLDNLLDKSTLDV